MTTTTRDEAVRDVLAQTERRENGLRANMDEVATLAHQMLAIIRRGALRPDPKTGWLEPASAPAPASGGVDAVARIAGFLRERDESLLPEEADDAERQASAEEIIRLASLSPAATTVSEAEPGLIDRLIEVLSGERKSWSREELDEAIRDPVKLYRFCLESRICSQRQRLSQLERENAAFRALAKPASSPAGGDVREVKLWDILDWIANMSTDQPVTNMANAGLKLFPNGRPATLSQSTSAGRVGE